MKSGKKDGGESGDTVRDESNSLTKAGSGFKRQ
jgi:hypothetical protein